MSKSQHPLWSDWYHAILKELKEAVKSVSLESVRINGAITKREVKIKDVDDIQANMPYVELMPAMLTDGHDDKGSGQPSIGANRYEKAGAKSIARIASNKERIKFGIEVQGNKIKDVMDTAQSLRRHFGASGQFSSDRGFGLSDGKDYSKNYSCTDVAFAKDVTDATGNPENYFAAMELTVYIESDRSLPAEKTANIAQIQTNFTGSF